MRNITTNAGAPIAPLLKLFSLPLILNILFQVRLAGSRDVPRLLPSEQPIRVPAVIGHLHLLPRLSNHEAGRGHRLRSPRASRPLQEDGRDRHTPGHAQELMHPRTNDTPLLIPASYTAIGLMYFGHILHFYFNKIGRFFFRYGKSHFSCLFIVFFLLYHAFSCR